METNYEKQVQIARGLFQKYDQEAMIRRLDAAHDAAWLYLDFIGDRYRIGREDGKVEVYDEEKDAFSACDDFNVVMTLYDTLCYSEAVPVLAHDWCTLANLQKTGSPSADIFNQKYADLFAGKTERLQRACESFGGTRPQITAGADVCWQFDLFPFFPLQFRFWDRDEEFPAKIQMLWDRNSLQFMHFETLYYAMGHLMRKLKEKFTL